MYLCEIENVNSSNIAERSKHWLEIPIKSPLTIWFKNSVSLKSNFEFIYSPFNWLEIHKFHAGTRRWTLSINFLNFLKHHSLKSVNTFNKHYLQVDSSGYFHEVIGKLVEERRAWKFTQLLKKAAWFRVNTKLPCSSQTTQPNWKVINFSPGLESLPDNNFIVFSKQYCWISNLSTSEKVNDGVKNGSRFRIFLHISLKREKNHINFQARASTSFKNNISNNFFSAKMSSADFMLW